MAQTRFMVNGKKLHIDSDIAEEYEKKTGRTLNNREMEDIFMSCNMFDAIPLLPEGMLEDIAEREMCYSVWVPTIQIKIYNNTKTVTLQRRTAIIFARYRGLSEKALECYMLWHFKGTEEELKSKSDEELSKWAQHVVFEELKALSTVRKMMENSKL